MLGGHVIKVGLGPLLRELIRRGVITHLALNGSAAIHDFELAAYGGTSEDVAAGLADGTFGMVEETGRDMNAAIAEGARRSKGMGEALADSVLVLLRDLTRRERVLVAALRDREARLVAPAPGVGERSCRLLELVLGVGEVVARVRELRLAVRLLLGPRLEEGGGRRRARSDLRGRRRQRVDAGERGRYVGVGPRELLPQRSGIHQSASRAASTLSACAVISFSMCEVGMPRVLSPAPRAERRPAGVSSMARQFSGRKLRFRCAPSLRTAKA